jgi:EAL domain-containing protein (putative c-di-GMP-specific phosphodiesterase class I)
MYRAKTDPSQSVCYYDTEIGAAVRDRRVLANDLRHAISNDELDVHYQVQTSVTDGAIRGYEALLRWTHPERGAISPARFIPLAESNGLILALGEWVLRRACKDASRWEPGYKVAVNLSSVQLAHTNLPDLVARVLKESGRQADRLELELTETAVVKDKVRSLDFIQQIKALGVSVALDDFGTGYSSLSYLTMFPFDKIKIDKSFTQNITKRAECAAIVSSVLTLGRCLGITTTAEGVETEEQFTLLRAAGVNTVQGYLFGRPCPASELDLGLAAIQSTASAA